MTTTNQLTNEASSVAQPGDSGEVAHLTRALSMADSIIGNLISAFENKDTAMVEKMLAAMSARRAQTDRAGGSLH